MSWSNIISIHKFSRFTITSWCRICCNKQRLWPKAGAFCLVEWRKLWSTDALKFWISSGVTSVCGCSVDPHYGPYSLKGKDPSQSWFAIRNRSNISYIEILPKQPLHSDGWVIVSKKKLLHSENTMDRPLHHSQQTGYYGRCTDVRKRSPLPFPPQQLRS